MHFLKMKNQKKNQWRKFSNEIKILLKVFKQKKKSSKENYQKQFLNKIN